MTISQFVSAKSSTRIGAAKSMAWHDDLGLLRHPSNSSQYKEAARLLRRLLERPEVDW